MEGLATLYMHRIIMWHFLTGLHDKLDFLAPPSTELFTPVHKIRGTVGKLEEPGIQWKAEYMMNIMASAFSTVACIRMCQKWLSICTQRCEATTPATHVFVWEQQEVLVSTCTPTASPLLPPFTCFGCFASALARLSLGLAWDWLAQYRGICSQCQCRGGGLRCNAGVRWSSRAFITVLVWKCQLWHMHAARSPGDA